MKSMSLKNVLKKYESLSLAKSVYTITSWYSNRNHVAFVDHLNRAFLNIENGSQNGKKISTYEDFCVIFREVVSELDKHIDPMIEGFPIDKGAVKFYSDYKFQKIFIGNGSEDIYEACFFIEKLVKDDEQLKTIWREILEYENHLLSILSVENTITSEEFELPPEEYFSLVFEKYESLERPELWRFFKGFKSCNEELYDIFEPHNGYPLFLPLLKECFLEKIEQSIPDEDFRKTVWITLFMRLVDNFLFLVYKETKVLFYIGCIDKLTNERVEFGDSLSIFGERDSVIFVSDNIDDSLLFKLNKGLKEGKYDLVGHTHDGKTVRTEPREGANIVFQKVDDIGLSPNEFKMALLSEGESYVDAKGLMGIINFASSIEEMIEFIIFLQTDSASEKMMNSSGITAHFQIWQEMNKVIVEGAVETRLAIFPYESAHQVMSFFENDLCNYPYDKAEDFPNVHYWKKTTDESSDLSLHSKGGSGSLDLFVHEEKAIIYQELHFMVEDLNDKTVEAFSSFNEIIMNTFNEYKKLILSHYSKKILEINIISEEVLKRNAINQIIIESKYCKKVIIDGDNATQILLVRPYWDKILSDNISIQTKAFENKLALDLLEGGDFGDFQTLETMIENNNDAPRSASMNEIAIKYYIKVGSRFSPPDFTAFKKARKIMAQTVKKLELEARKYDESEILNIVQNFRTDIRNSMLAKLTNLDKVALHKVLLNKYSAILFQIDIHKRRLDEFEKNISLKLETLNEFRNKTIELREESRTYKQILEYLMEENLLRKNSESLSNLKDEEVDELIAYSKWIVDFQSISDAVNYGATNWSNLEIRDDYVIEIQESDNNLKNAELIRHLRYTYGEYSNRDNAIDKSTISKIDQSFYEDTGLTMEVLVTTLTLMSSHSYVMELIDKEDVISQQNIVEVSIDILCEFFVEETKLSREDFYKVLYFISVDVNQIANDHGVIPIWEQKKRKHKLSAQPVFVDGNNLIYSPISLHELNKSWTQGMMNFLLPYNEGMENLTKLIESWKKKYENKIVQDLASLFDKATCEIYKDKELYKLDKKGGHPRDLGDYDVIVIDKGKKEVLLFEVKYMRMSQTVKDILGDQHEYFMGKKAKAKKFEKRVNYFKDNAKKIMKNLGFEEDFSVKSYFIANKNIRSYFVEYPFDVVSLNEFEKKDIVK